MNDHRNDWYQRDESRYRQDSYRRPYTPWDDRGEAPGRGDAVTSMILGIAALACWFFGYTVVGSIVLGIIGLVYANRAKRAGYVGTARTTGFVCSLVGLIGGCLILLFLILFGAALFTGFTSAISGAWGYYY